MIVDVHVHLGFDYTFDIDFTREELVNKIDEHNIDMQIVQPGTEIGTGCSNGGRRRNSGRRHSGKRARTTTSTSKAPRCREQR